MIQPESRDTVATRLRHLLSLYEDPSASVAHLLCDRHDLQSIAYRVVDADFAIRELTFGDLANASRRLANGLAQAGFGREDRIATLLGKGVDYLVTLLAIWRLGAVHVPLFTAFAPAAISMRLTASNARLVICDAAQRPKLDARISGESVGWRILTTGDTKPGDLSFQRLMEESRCEHLDAVVGGDAPFIQIYTSGTTGAPKGVIVPVRALASFQAYAEFALDLRVEEVFWNAADPGWGYGLYFGVLAALTTGCAGTFLLQSFSAETTYEVLDRLQVSNFAAAPTVYRSLKASNLAVPTGINLRCASSAGEPLTPEVNGWARSALKLEIYDHYGQTETGMLINNHHHPALRRPIRPGCMGRAMPGWKAVVLKPDSNEPANIGETGRLAMDLQESPLAWFRGYVADPSRSAERFSSDGRWYYTGDNARVDDEESFYFGARDDDVIIMAGYRIGPLEVETVILSHEAIAECAVVAVPDEVRGEVLVAAVVLLPTATASAALTEEIKQSVKKGFAAHAYPRQVHYVDELPKTPSGKIQRFLVRKYVEEALRVETKAGNR